jgi:hypothetical protein
LAAGNQRCQRATFRVGKFEVIFPGHVLRVPQNVE